MCTLATDRSEYVLPLFSLGVPCTIELSYECPRPPVNNRKFPDHLRLPLVCVKNDAGEKNVPGASGEGRRPSPHVA